jgi:3-oxoacyl-[acyl-carrier protein] reductase
MSEQEQPIALVTGGTRGLGRAIAVELAQRGYHMILNYRHEHEEAKKTVALIHQFGGSAELRQADLANSTEINGLFAGLSRLDLLVNNAGITRDELLLLMRPDSWKSVVATNLSAVFHCSQIAARIMCAAGRGVIIHIGSSSGASARTGQANYSSAKSALFGMTRSMARELAVYGVRVLTVAPGFTSSDMARAVSDTVAQQSLSRIPLGRWGRVEEIARTIAFLASHAASGFSGQTWMVDGGRTTFESEVGL